MLKVKKNICEAAKPSEASLHKVAFDDQWLYDWKSPTFRSKKFRQRTQCQTRNMSPNLFEMFQILFSSTYNSLMFEMFKWQHLKALEKFCSQEIQQLK